VLITWSKAMPEQAGRELAEIARNGASAARGRRAAAAAGAIYWMMDEADVRRVLAFEHTMIGSDGLPHDVHPHPRLWGTFPRVLGHYCREVGLFGLEAAVRKMTGLPAARFGLSGRGHVTAAPMRPLRVRSRDGDRPRHLREPTLPAPVSPMSCQRPPGVVRRQALGERPGAPAPPADAGGGRGCPGILTFARVRRARR